MDMHSKREMRKNKKMNEDTKSLPSTSINWYPGHMAKTKREIGEKLNLIDLVYEIVDARMPLSSRIEEVDNIIKKSKNQTDNIILDITNTKISRDSIIKQVQKVFSTSGREWVKTIMIIDNYHLLKIYQRK